jgi:adenosine deaminase/adenosine deaminase CECR1
VVAFISADSSPLMAGVNIVSEDGATSMKDYWLHMVMFNYCHTKFPDVKYSMHAELTLGLVQPEDLTSHQRRFLAGANRIGHRLIWLMKANHTSCCATWQKQDSHRNQLVNEFILKVKENHYRYRAFGFPL